ncbi:hypothetical protein VUR80DRAFT_2525 [Thermomyces stellatus]
MATAAFCSATVEDYDEGPSDSEACGGAPPSADSNVDIVPLKTPVQQQAPLSKSRKPSQPSPAQVQSDGPYPPGAHLHQSLPHSHGEVGPPSARLPKAPTAPLDPAPKKSKRKTSSSSSRRRNKDRPEYYGVRGPSTSVVPAIPPEALPRSSNVRIARRPTAAWCISGPGSGSPPDGTADPAPAHTANPLPRIHGTRGVPLVNTSRNSGSTRLGGQQSPPHSHDDGSHDWETTETPNRALETPGGDATDSSPEQPPRPGPRFIALNQGHGGPPRDANRPASGLGGGYDQSPPPPQAPSQHNPHGVIVLSSNSNRPTGPANQPPPRRDFYPILFPDDERRSPSPSHHQPMPQYNGRAAAHQMPGRQSVHPVHSPPVQSRTGYRKQRDQPLQDAPSQDAPSQDTSAPYQDFQRLSLGNIPPHDRRAWQAPAHPDADQFRSHDVPAPPLRLGSVPDSYEPSVHKSDKGPRDRHRGGYPAANEPVCYRPHPQQRNSQDRYLPAQRRPQEEAAAPETPGDWLGSRGQWVPRTPHPHPQPPQSYPIPEESNHVESGPQRQIDYSVKPSRAVPPQLPLQRWLPRTRGKLRARHPQA